MMKKHYILTLMALLASVAIAQPDFENVYGYAAMEGGTTGGKGGQVVTPTNFNELQIYVSGEEPRIILIDREFKGPNVLRMGSNKTLFGVGTKGFFNQIGVSIQCQHNIVIRNIKFTMVGVPITNDGENKIEGFNFDPDCIAIQADDENLPESQRKSHHIWIDHCEFYNEDPNVMTNVDRYDGLIDQKNDCQYITISYNYFHDHHKGCLSGKGNSDDYDRKTTMHHNKFENIHSRMPLQRFGKLHLLNNYVVNCPEGNGLNVRINSNAYVEKNYFDNVKKPIFGKLSEGGRAHLLDNKFVNCGRLPLIVLPNNDSPGAEALSSSEEFEDTDYVPPYLYASICVPVTQVPSHVNQYAGVGKIQFIAQQTYDCNGVLNGSAYYDNCNKCVGGNTQKIACIQDCNGDWGGNAFLDACSVCTGGNTGNIPNSTCAIDCNGDMNGNAYVDACGNCVGGATGITECSEFLEAEDACAFDGTIDNDNTGFTGEGFVNTTNAIGAYVNWQLYSTRSQSVTIIFRYANGGTTSRNGSVKVNGLTVGTLVLVPTGAWTTWVTSSITLNLNNGSNTLELIALSADGLANIDALHLPAGVTVDWCVTGLSKDSDRKLVVYPNPTSGIIWLSELSDWSLKNIHAAELSQGKGTQLDLSALPSGLYFLEVEEKVYQLVKE